MARRRRIIASKPADFSAAPQVVHRRTVTLRRTRNGPARKVNDGTEGMSPRAYDDATRPLQQTENGGGDSKNGRGTEGRDHERRVLPLRTRQPENDTSCREQETSPSSNASLQASKIRVLSNSRRHDAGHSHRSSVCGTERVRTSRPHPNCLLASTLSKAELCMPYRGRVG